MQEKKQPQNKTNKKITKNEVQIKNNKKQTNKQTKNPRYSNPNQEFFNPAPLLFKKINSLFTYSHVSNRRGCGIVGGLEEILKTNSQGFGIVGGWKNLENLIAGGGWNFVCFFCFFFNHKNY